MSTPVVTIVDFGMGNLFSVARALEHCGAEIRMTTSADGIASAERLVLPGVGAFGKGVDNLRQLGLVSALRSYGASGRPMLGICLGMQLLFEEGEEFGLHEGLGIMPGRIVPIPATGVDGTPHRVPHVGWAEIHPAAAAAWDGGLLDGVAVGAAMYFVHGFQADCAGTAVDFADCTYDGRVIPAVVRQGAVWGCQFHPERSGPAGLRIVANYIGT